MVNKLCLRQMVYKLCYASNCEQAVFASNGVQAVFASNGEQVCSLHWFGLVCSAHHERNRYYDQQRCFKIIRKMGNSIPHTGTRTSNWIGTGII